MVGIRVLCEEVSKTQQCCALWQIGSLLALSGNCGHPKVIAEDEKLQHVSGIDLLEVKQLLANPPIVAHSETASCDFILHP